VVELTDKPFPPGQYDLVVVGSGPGALQLTYSLRRLGIQNAVISDDPAPGGMFRRWPIFQRMLSWTKPYAPEKPGTPAYERFDWNSLLADEPENRAIMPRVMDGTSYFPSRPEMERGLVGFVEGTRLAIRYGCRWESTRRDGDGFALDTSDGEYRAGTVVFAVGVAEPWRPPVLSLPGVEQYGDLKPVEAYRDHRIFIAGKQNSGFEIATGLLPWAKQIIIASPSPTRLSVDVRSLAGVRARYVQPYEDWALAGGVVVLDASIEQVEKTGAGFRVVTRNPQEDHNRTFDVDDVIAATGFVAPLRDLRNLGVTTFGHSRLPTQDHFWQSADVPGIFFAGTLMQGAQGLRKHGIPSNSGAVQGYRYNARVLARRIAEQRLGKKIPRPRLKPEDVAPLLLREASHGPELWHQRAYLARVVVMDQDQGLYDDGIQPLAHFLDESEGPDALAMTLESNGKDDPYPVAYTRRRGDVREIKMAPDPMLDFEHDENLRQLAEITR
jgi:thioredoxin reductase